MARNPPRVPGEHIGEKGREVALHLRVSSDLRDPVESHVPTTLCASRTE